MENLFVMIALFYGFGILFILFASNFRFTVGHDPVVTKFGKNIVNICILLALVFLFYMSVNAPDSGNYKEAFANSIAFYSNGVRKKFSYGLMLIVSKFTENYQIYRGVVGFIFIMPYLIMMWNDKIKHINWLRFLALLCIYPLWCSTISLNYTLSMVVCIIAFYYFFHSSKGMNSIIISFIILLSGCMFHDTAVVYVAIFLIYLLIRKKRALNSLLILLLFGVFIGIIGIRWGNLSAFILRFAGDNNRQFLYVESLHNAGMGYLICIAIHILTIVVVRKFAHRHRREALETDREFECLAISSCLLMPFYAMNFLFMRIFRGLIYIFYMIFADKRMDSHKDADLMAMIAVVEALLFIFEESSYIGGILG